MVQARRNSARLIALAAALAAGSLALSARARALSLPGRAITLKTSDGWTLSGRYRAANDGKLTLILIHGTGRSKELWTEMANVLVRSGYGVLAFDLRGHGESAIGPGGKAESWRQFSASRDNNDFLAMGKDVEAAADYLSSVSVSSSSVGLVGEGLGAALALRYAVVHPQTPFVALISPGLDDQNVPLLSALRGYGSRPILIVYSQSDRSVANAAPLISAVAKLSAGAQNVTVIASNLRSNFLFGRTISQDVKLWLKEAAAAAVATSTSTAPGLISVSSPSAAAAPAQAPPNTPSL